MNDTTLHDTTQEPNAPLAGLSHSAQVLVEDVRALLKATADSADEKVAQARERLREVLERGKETYAQLSESTVRNAQAVDTRVRENPWTTAAVALGVGAVLGYFLSRPE